MLNLQLSEKQAVMLAGILGATEGWELNSVYSELTGKLNEDDRIVADDITNLINEQLLMNELVINEDNLYIEAKYLNESL